MSKCDGACVFTCTCERVFNAAIEITVLSVKMAKLFFSVSLSLCVVVLKISFNLRCNCHVCMHKFSSAVIAEEAVKWFNVPTEASQNAIYIIQLSTHSTQHTHLFAHTCVRSYSYLSRENIFMFCVNIRRCTSTACAVIIMNRRYLSTSCITLDNYFY